jgi:histidinol-phosphate aminotransferase
MEPYTPILPFEVLSDQLGRPPEAIIKLDANENPYGPGPATLAALRDLQSVIPIYPDPESRQLRAQLADYLKVPTEHILAGAGADELIDLIMRLFLNPADKVINCPPTFGMYGFDADLAGAQVVNIRRGVDFSLALHEVERAALDGAKLLFLCSPNNPDGSLILREDLERLLALPLIIVLDEAYIEFSQTESAATLVPDHPNLIVLRTFSKWAGLAGLRIGYGVFPSWMMNHLWKIKQPYNVNVAADAAARASLNDLPLLMDHVKAIIRERIRLEVELSRLTYLEPYPSHSNFVLCKVVGRDASQVKARLASDYGILIRYFSKPGLEDHIRISAGRPDQMDALLKALYSLGESL